MSSATSHAGRPADDIVEQTPREEAVDLSPQRLCALTFLLRSAPVLQDVFALGRVYAEGADAHCHRAYAHMVAVWRAHSVADFGADPQAAIQAALLLHVRPDLAGAPGEHTNALRAAGIYMAAIMQLQWHTRARITVATALQLNAIAIRDDDGQLSTAARALLYGAVRIANGVPLHGPAYAPDDPAKHPCAPQDVRPKLLFDAHRNTTEPAVRIAVAHAFGKDIRRQVGRLELDVRHRGVKRAEAMSSGEGQDTLDAGLEHKFQRVARIKMALDRKQQQ